MEPESIRIVESALSPFRNSGANLPVDISGMVASINFNTRSASEVLRRALRLDAQRKMACTKSGISIN